MPPLVHRSSAGGRGGIANGRLQRARRLLDGQPTCYEHGLLAYTEGYLRVDVDPAKAEEAGRRTLELADELANMELQMLGLALRGFALVNAGEVARGMDLLDESTAIAVASSNACTRFLTTARQAVRTPAKPHATVTRGATPGTIPRSTQKLTPHRNDPSTPTARRYRGAKRRSSA